ncbi:MAG: hypothetical protein WA004_03720 [Saprospiraceae bacterium]
MSKLIPSFLLLTLTALPLSGQLMYPGDTNNDGVANYLDLLPIGIAFGVEGEPRPLASENWFAQPFIIWDYFLPTTFVNGGYINANGDAIIDTLDLDAIVANYDLLQDTAAPMPWQHNVICATCPPALFSITYSDDSVAVNEPFQAFISLLYPETIPQELGALGVAAELSFDPDLVVEEAVMIEPNQDEGTLMFVTATSQSAFGYRLPSPGRIQFAAAGRGENALYKDNNLLATASFVVVADIQRDTVFRAFKMQVENLLLLNLQEEMLPVFLMNQDSVVLYQPLNQTSEAPLSEALKVFPNPAGPVIGVRSGRFVRLDYLRVWDSRGVLAASLEKTEGVNWEIPTAGFAPGIYWVEARSGGEYWRQRVLIFP